MLAASDPSLLVWLAISLIALFVIGLILGGGKDTGEQTWID